MVARKCLPDDKLFLVRVFFYLFCNDTDVRIGRVRNMTAISESDKIHYDSTNSKFISKSRLRFAWIDTFHIFFVLSEFE